MSIQTSVSRAATSMPLRLAIAFLALLTAVAVPAAAADFDTLLPIPPLAERRQGDDGAVVFDLVARSGSRSFFGGSTTPTYGYNGDYLGPTLRVFRGERVRVRVHNTLEEATTVHWHGLEVPGEMDGGPHQPIAPGTVWEPEFTVRQPAASLWYHPHLLGLTAEQVYRGLAGMLIIEDPAAETAASLPRRYGVDDIPVVVQDRRFDRDGHFAYRVRMPELINGYLGDVFLVNGAVKPVVEVPAGVVRLRLLNGSSSSIYRFSLSDGSSFVQIASDGGLLASPLQTPKVVLSTGERAEVLLDLSRPGKQEPLFLNLETYGGLSAAVLKIAVNPAARGTVAKLPAGPLTDLRRVPPESGARTRRFELQTMGGGMGRGMMGARLSINGRQLDMKRVDFSAKAGRTELWELTNPAMGMMNVPHSFHVHGVQFQILDIDGRVPPPELAGWKDTVLVWPGEQVRIVVPFPDNYGIYMFHCHLLEHEDDGMMGQFRLEP